ncbi:MAG: selenide, water dikinase SelD [Alphaproteobacteria bacterium]|nr:selenide, water dikinase SelD [Alphaproteobacteria bacterium]
MQPASPVEQDLVLVGGGHAHVHVLKSFGMRPVAGVRVTLIAREVETPYSGMLPGYVAGDYAFAECHIDLGRLARFAGARLIRDEAVGLDRAARQVLCRAHPPIRYDVMSLDIGSTPRLDDVPGAERHTVPVKPIARFAERWEDLLARAGHAVGLRLAVIGGGAGGVELALAAQHRLAGLVRGALSVTLVTRDALLPSHAARVRRRFAKILAERGIRVVTGAAVVAAEAGGLCIADGGFVAFDEALWVTEAAGAPWLASTGLPLDRRGFVLVDDTLRAVGDPLIFAAGDIATMRAHPRDKAGVYAVQAGPPLADNLRRTLAAAPLRRAVPPRRALALIGTGDGRAVASRGAWTASGRLPWHLKRWIDRRWMRGYTELPQMVPPTDEEAMRCGGCAAKVPAEVLTRVIAGLPPQRGAGVAIGLEGADDAALLTFPDSPPVLQTVDFFRAMVEDPYLFGRIAATHALGDIYAMGGVPETALAIATVPAARPAIVEHDLSHMLHGGLEVLQAAGVALVGGHSAEGAELALGFAVTGTLPGKPLRKGGLRPADRLILTKPLGTGVILAAEMRGMAPARVVAGALAAMVQPAAAAAQCLRRCGATACTDVTGFGLLGHLGEMLRASATDARLDPEAVPALDGALPLIRAGVASSLQAGNLAAAAALAPGDAEDPIVGLLIDPQTAGGLLAGIPADRSPACLAELRRLGYRAAEIGIVESATGAGGRVVLEPGCLEPAPVLPQPVPAR